MALQTINVRCLVDDRKFRISARGADAKQRDLAHLTGTALHQRLSQQTGIPSDAFGLRVGSSAVPPYATMGVFLSGTRDSIVVDMAPSTPQQPHSDDADDLGHGSHGREAAGSAASTTPPRALSTGSTRHADPTARAAASMFPPRPHPSTTRSNTSRNHDDDGHSDVVGGQLRGSALRGMNSIDREEALLRHEAERDREAHDEGRHARSRVEVPPPWRTNSDVPSSGRSTRRGDATPDTSRISPRPAHSDTAARSASPAGSARTLDELRYQLEVVEGLIAEDREAWERAEQEARDLGVADAKRERAMLDADTAKYQHEATSLERNIQKVEQEIDDRRDQVSEVVSQREQLKSAVDAAAHEVDRVKAKILERLAECNADEQKDADVLDRLVHIVAQKHLAMVQLSDAAQRVDRLQQAHQRVAYQRRTLHNTVEELKGNIRVIVRMRPLVEGDFKAPQHAARLEEGSLALNTEENSVTTSSPSAGTHSHEFYKVYGPPDAAAPPVQQQRLIFLEQVQPVMQSLFDGVNVSVIAYGQTGSGKTYTIFGEHADGDGGSSGNAAAGTTSLTGMLPQALASLFEQRAINIAAGSDVTVTLSMIELYNNDVIDLIAASDPSIATVAARPAFGSATKAGKATHPAACEVRVLANGGAAVVGASEVRADDVETAMDIVRTGFLYRTTHKTHTNAQSSRSHLILTVNVATSHPNANPVSSKLLFVDLAGSERVHRSLSTGDRLKEAQHINKSLSALGDVLGALTTRTATHVPYRNSKLTLLLQQCVGGNSKTLMVACICPHIPERHNLGETASTLMFAARAKLVRNRITRPNAPRGSSTVLYDSSQQRVRASSAARASHGRGAGGDAAPIENVIAA